MKIALIAAGRGWHVRDLERAAASRSIEVELVPFPALHAAILPGRKRPESRLLGGGVDLSRADVALVRTMPGGSLEQVVYRMDALHELERMGVPVINPPRSLETAIDKYLSLCRLAAAGLPVPATAVAEGAGSALEAFEELGGDVVVKPLFGSQGRDLRRVQRRSDAVALFGELEAAGSVIYQQEFVDHPGWDLRVLVVGDRVAAGMRRRATDGWITNVARGGVAEPLPLSGEAERLALRASRAVGAEISGVDLLPDRAGGLRVLEVNAVPGWRALARVAGRDLAGAVLDHLAGRRRET